MSLEVVSAASSNYVSTGPLAVGEVEARIAEATAGAIHAIVLESISRKKEMALAKGVYYPHEYCDLLKQSKDAGATARLNWFKERDCFYHGYLSNKHFDMISVERCPFTDSASKFLRQAFVVKKGVSPSEAIRSAKEGPSLLGCGEVCQLAQYAALLSVLGAEKFDLLFAEDSQTPLTINSSVLVNPLNLLRRHVKKVNPDSSEIKKGSQVYIYNANSYLSKHPFGIAQGFNALCVDCKEGAHRFTSLGLPADGLMHEEVNDVLIEEHNSENVSVLEQWTSQTGEKVRRASVQAFEMARQMKDTVLSMDAFKEQEGGKLVLLYEWDVQRITELANATPKEARGLFTHYDNERRTVKK